MIADETAQRAQRLFTDGASSESAVSMGDSSALGWAIRAIEAVASSPVTKTSRVAEV
jgi:hypothetical protein